ncbi:MAG: hypothetical protein IPK16_27190 [Anaerolineales bacterium]|nr:hypothetical protein [Anaerolineales bacterium]
MIEYIAGSGSRITQRALKDTRFPANAIVGAVLRNGRLHIPNGEMQIAAGDRVVVFTMADSIQDLDRLFGK